MTDSEIYRDIILEHYRYPHNFGSLPTPDVQVKDSNPLCGDVIEMQLEIKGGVIEDAKFRGTGCAISMAAASMLTEAIRGKSLEAVKSLGREDILKMLGIALGPTRLKCAMLGLKVAKLGVYGYLNQPVVDE